MDVKKIIVILILIAAFVLVWWVYQKFRVEK